VRASILCLALSLLCGLRAPPERDEQPNVILFVIDDVADSDIDAIRTPALDSLAERGVRFRRAYSHAWCSPSRDSLLFSAWDGRYRGNDCDAGDAVLRPSAEFTLAKLFQSAGYTTAHFGKWHLGASGDGSWRQTPHTRGFDRWICSMAVGSCEIPPGGTEGSWVRLDDGVLSWEARPRTIALRDAVRGWWRETNTPKFAMVNFRAAHAPFRRPPDELLYDWAKAKSSTSSRARFELEVIGVDHVIGELLPVLGDDTIVLFTSDNGTPGGRQRKLDGTRPDQDPDRVKSSCYEDGVRVPLILSLPGSTQAVESDALIHLVDFLPTFGELLGIPYEASVEGISFVPALEGGPGAREWVYVHRNPEGPKAIIARRWKLLVKQNGEEELYDLQEDPREEAPLPQGNENADGLRSILSELVAGFD